MSGSLVGGYLLCILAPFALLGVMMMVQLRLDLARSCVRAIKHPWERRESPVWRVAGLAAANILIPLAASFFGMAALTASFLGETPLVSRSLHGLNVAQGVLGLVLVVQLLRSRKDRLSLR